MTMLTRALLTIGTVAALATGGCASIDQSIDCDNICDRYRDCFDSSYDADACQARCEDMIDSNRHAVETCDACIDGIDCTSAVFECGSQCSAIVP